MKRFLTIRSLVLWAAAGFCLSGGAPRQARAEGLPNILSGQTFVCDELETGEGDSLYTLDFSEDGYRLYRDGGDGIISEGLAEVSGNGELTFTEEWGSGTGNFFADYRGSAFEEPSLTLNYDGRELAFTPAGETDEYVYLAYLGVFEGSMDGSGATLILERWKEFYLYSEGRLIRGTYEIYEDGTVSLAVLDRESISAEPAAADGENTSGEDADLTGESTSVEPADPEEKRTSAEKADLTGESTSVEPADPEEESTSAEKAELAGERNSVETADPEETGASAETADPAGECISGEITKPEGEALDLRNVTIKLGGAAFTWAEPEQTCGAEHAMGTYTLSLYDGNVFVIRGADGYVKAMGLISYAADGGQAVYFPRSITGEAETDEKFTVSFTVSEDGLIFPAITPLLPRSGNINEETGYGSYWNAGTTLEFLENAETETKYTVTYEPQDTEGREAPIREMADTADDAELTQVMPSLGTARPLVLLIDFPDCKRPRFVTAGNMEEALFSLENQDSLSAYYFRSSYGNLTIDGTVLGWYRAQKDRGSYESDTELMEEALEYYIEQEGLKLSDYDADGDGCVDSLYVLWAGNLETDGGIWSAAYRSSWADSPGEWDARVTGYIFVPGNTVWSSVPPLTCNLNSLTHETGHLLGLNDYYSYDTSDRADGDAAYTGGALEGGLGGMDMMDANIADHNAFSKWLLGWLEPEVISYEEIASLQDQERTYTLRPSNEWGDALFIKLEASDSMSCELLVVEAISSTMNNSELTGLKEPAVRILHVEASLDEDGLSGNWRGFGFRYDNSYTSTKFISLLEADGESTVLNFIPTGSVNRISYDPADCFSEGSRITPNTWPNTNGYDAYGNAAVYNGLCISVESIAEDGTAVIRLGYEEQADTLQMVSVTPAATIVPYQEGEEVTIPADTEEIVITFDRGIEPAGANALEEIKVVSGNQFSEGWHAEIQECDLRIVFDEPLEAGCGYTLIVPRGVLADAQDAEIVNNSNSIYGFLTTG